MPRLRVATWNCQHGKPAPERLAESVGLLDVDVLAMQEVDRNTARVEHRDLAELARESFGGEMTWASAFTMGADGDYGNALLVRGEIRDPTVLALPGRRRGKGSEPRVAILAEVVAAGRPWTIAATHLSTRSEVATQQLVSLLAALEDRPAPRLLIGDLNLQPQLLLPWLTAESYRLALGPLTHPADRPRRQIDHVAVAGRGCHVVPVDSLQLPVGDHRALVADISCPG